MKRSEMLNILEKAVGKHTGCESDYDMFIAKDLLKVIEEAGMAPPIITILPHSYNRHEGTMGYEVHEWEPEDEL